MPSVGARWCRRQRSSACAPSAGQSPRPAASHRRSRKSARRPEARLPGDPRGWQNARAASAWRDHRTLLGAIRPESAARAVLATPRTFEPTPSREGRGRGGWARVGQAWRSGRRETRAAHSTGSGGRRPRPEAPQPRPSAIHDGPLGRSRSAPECAPARPSTPRGKRSEREWRRRIPPPAGFEPAWQNPARRGARLPDHKSAAGSPPDDARTTP